MKKKDISRPYCDKYMMDDHFLSELFGLGGKRKVANFRASSAYAKRIEIAERIAKRVEDKLREYKL